MKRSTLAVALIFFVFTACKSKEKSSWPESEKKSFIESCEKKAMVEVGADKAKSYCSCMLGKVEAKYPKPLDAMGMDMKTMMEMAKDCVK